MDAETPDVGFVSVSWSMPLVSRWRILEAVEFVPCATSVGRYIQMRWMSAHVEALAVRTRDDRIHFFPWDVKILPPLSGVH
jgi:hypothetical protein